MKVLLTAALLLCGSVSFAIIDGKPVKNGNPVASHVALLVASTAKGTAFCSSTIIADNLLLTAAHCVEGTQAQNVVAIFATDVTIKDLGNRKWMTNKVDKHLLVRVQNFKINPNYNPNEVKDNSLMENASDLAVVELAQSVPSGYAPVSIYTGSTPQDGAVTVAGYGMTKANQNNKKSFQLRDTTIGITQVYSKVFVRDASDRQGKPAVCEGDSGGPAFAQISGDLELVGTTIISSCDGSGQNLDVWERDGYFQPWIQSAVSDLRSGAPSVASL